MAFFGWFKSAPKTPQGPQSRPGAAAVGEDPAAGLKNGSARSGNATADVAARHKGERARLRDLLYKVVRESMVRVGVLSSGFKFKVLATDPRGRKFIVMMDLSRDFGSEISQLSEIESLIIQSAKSRHNIVVSAVYWRTEEARADDKTASAHPGEKYRATVPGTAPETHGPAHPESMKSKFEPVLADELSALKRALATGGAGVAAAAMATAPAPTTHAPSSTALLTGFENTEIIESEFPEHADEHEVAETQMLDDEAQYPALGPTQYGDLR